MSSHDTIRQILDLARWAPSGDNTQPFRFEILDANHVVVHGFDTRDHCVYDLDGHPSQISLGALLETASIAASSHGMQMTATRRLHMADNKPTFDLTFTASPDISADPLAAAITKRSVQRRPFQTRPLSTHEKQTLENCLPSGYRLHWIEGAPGRWRTARLMFSSAKLRLTTPEAYEVHRDIIEWDCQFSTTKVPDQALGVDAVTARVMRFVMKSWDRVVFFNRYFAGTIAPRLQMDLLPSLACAAHYVLYASKPAASIDDYVAAGRAMQRLWLTTTHLGLLMQPEVTPLVFTRYARDARQFSVVDGSGSAAKEIKVGFEQLVGQTVANQAVYMGRIGAGPQPLSRSLRRPLEDLLIDRKT
jgi:hypothetical protein